MNLQTLIAAIDQEDHTLVEKMNIQTDTLVGNQCGRNETERFLYRGSSVVYLNASDRGVGRNRNRLLDAATGNYLILADDDMRFVDGYPGIVEKALDACPDADVYLFNLIEKKPQRYINRSFRRIGRMQYARYGAARMVLRRAAIEEAGLRFSTEFGGGAKYGSGEDTIFLQACFKHGLRIRAVPYALAEIDQEAPSSWFAGYNEHYFYDKGALYAALHPVACRLYALRFVIRYRRRFAGQYGVREAARAMRRGMEAYLHESKGSD
ncbi:MAG: glycosyltransferase family 2 protein [Lachnospiraceae bacterium]|nr:glycosyltransferase family 2 protein [Lachnospiraceae bacterium]